MGRLQQPGPLAPLRRSLGLPDPVLTISYIKKKSFKSNLKNREGVCLQKGSWFNRIKGLKLQPEREVLCWGDVALQGLTSKLL